VWPKPLSCGRKFIIWLVPVLGYGGDSDDNTDCITLETFFLVTLTHLIDIDIAYIAMHTHTNKECGASESCCYFIAIS
jgi:hypothetical protein